MSKDTIGSVMVVGAGIAGMQAALDLETLAIMYTLWRKIRSLEGLWPNLIRHSLPMTAPCELCRPNWSRSAGT